MAKKKTTTQVDKQPPKQAERVHQGAAMDDSSEKIENLKNLNSMLLKETIEKRQQVDSLLSSKESLESELTRSEMEKQDLQAELIRLRDSSAQVEFERHLVSLFLSVQVNQQGKVAEKEMEGYWREKLEVEGRLRVAESQLKDVVREKSEMEVLRSEKESEIKHLQKKLSELVMEVGKGRNESKGLCQERDALKSELEARIEESNGLSLKLVDSEKRETDLKKEVEKLNSAYNGVIEEKEERDRRIEYILWDSDSIKSSLEGANRVIEKLKGEIEDLAREKKRVEEERNAEVMKNRDHEIAIAELNAVVLNLQKEEQKLRESVAALEKRCEEGIEKEKQMVKEINDLVKEKEEKDCSIQDLVGENSLIKEKLSDSLKKLDDQMRKTDEILSKKIEADEAKATVENEMAGLMKEMCELRDAISALEASNKNQSSENEKLQKQAAEFRDTITQITNERDVARKGYDEEKRIVKSSQEQILELEKSIEEDKKMIGQMKSNISELAEENKGLKKEIASLESNLLKARNEFDAMKSELEKANAKSDSVLGMLKSLSKDGTVNEEHVGEELKPYVVEFEAIKNGFKSREAKVEDMKREVEFLQHSVSESEKKKSFWTVVSSLTTIFAAASVAYAARGR